MTCVDFISTLPGGGDSAESLRLINELEARVERETANATHTVKNFYDSLALPAPYDRLYTFFIMARRELLAGEIARYNLFTAEFEALYCEYRNSLTRASTPARVNAEVGL